MKSFSTTASLALALGAAALSLPASAAFVTYNSQDAGATVASELARFKTDVVVIGENGFETAPTGFGSQINPLDFNGTVGDLWTNGGDYEICRTNTGNCLANFGRFNTTPNGNTWLQTEFTFTIDFAAGISALAFNMTDVGDFSGTLALELTAGDSTQSLVVLDDVTDNSSLAFFGFSDTDVKYNRIRFVITQAGPPFDVDLLGFDDILIGAINDLPPVGVPEPASAALVGAALLALGAARRRRN